MDRPEIDPYEFRSDTPSPVLPLNLDPPTPPATETPIQPLPEPTTQQLPLPGNSILLALKELFARVTTNNQRLLAQELQIKQLAEQTKHLVQIFTEHIASTSRQTSESQSFTPHRPWTQQLHNRRVQPICLFDIPTRPNTYKP